MARMGLYPGAPKTPCVLGLEAGGIIVEVGPEVEDFKVSYTYSIRVIEQIFVWCIYRPKYYVSNMSLVQQQL